MAKYLGITICDLHPSSFNRNFKYKIVNRKKTVWLRLARAYGEVFEKTYFFKDL